MDRIETMNAPKAIKGIIIYYAEYPNNGSWPNRINNFSKIFELLNFDYKIVIPYPPKTARSINSSRDNVVRLQDITQKKISNFKKLFSYATGILMSYKYIKSQNHLDFVLFAGGSFTICYPIIRICKRKAIKIWIDIVDENAKKFETNKSIRDYLAILNKDLFDKWLIPSFDKVFVISDFLFDKYSKISSNRNIQKSAPSIIDLEEYDKNSSRNIFGKAVELDRFLKDTRLKLLYAGSAARPNGILFVLDCAAELMKQHNYDFLIGIILLLGDKESLRRYAVNLGIEKNLVLIDKQNQIDLPAIYGQSDILFIPEHGNIIANAGFPGKTAELLASGKPILSTIFSDLEKYLINGENALLSLIGDKATYTSNLRKLLDDETLRNRIGANGRITAENEFDYKSCTSMFTDLASANYPN
jgi:glycosyltransferase involved in cell wall biosynthesis